MLIVFITLIAWIDYVLSSPEIDELVDSCYVQYDSISSDHKPVITVFKNLCPKCSQLVDEPQQSVGMYQTGHVLTVIV